MEAIRQLTDRALGHAVANARLALVSGFGMINFDRGLWQRRRGSRKGQQMTSPLTKPKRKNPILRTRLPVLPPGARSRVGQGVTAAAAEGALRTANLRPLRRGPVPA